MGRVPQRRTGSEIRNPKPQNKGGNRANLGPIEGKADIPPFRFSANEAAKRATPVTRRHNSKDKF